MTDVNCYDCEHCQPSVDIWSSEFCEITGDWVVSHNKNKTRPDNCPLGKKTEEAET